ncbi:MAG TPA: SDR family NAD(P)-dependent oxidoreductase [Urbifossiella sp.]|jgi:short-subunit dehydrogenase
MSYRKIPGTRSLVTGASGGIGRAIAVELARQGSKVLLLARREEALAAVADEIRKAGGTAECVAGDVTDPAVRRAALDRAAEKFGGLDILVNNAGIGATGRFDMAQPETLRKIFEVNFFAAAEMTREALPLLRQGVRPIVVNIASVLGHRAGPQMSEYSASKFALRGLSQALRNELRPAGIDVLVVSPGTTETEFFGHIVDGDGTTRWPHWGAVTAASVARSTVRAIRHKRHEIIPNFPGWFLTMMNRLCPRLIDELMNRYV